MIREEAERRTPPIAIDDARRRDLFIVRDDRLVSVRASIELHWAGLVRLDRQLMYVLQLVA